MISRLRLLPVAVLVLMLGAALFLGRPTSSAILYTGVAQASTGPLALEIVISPPVGQTGNVLQMLARVSNRDVRPLTPSVMLQLPRNLVADVFSLPSGATFNLQENRIDWLPVVPAGSATEFALDLTVQAIDILNPEQTITGAIRHQGSSSEATSTIWLGMAPLVGDLLSQDRVAVGQPVRLVADITGPGPIKTLWNLGDGRRLDVASPEVVYPTAGQFEITMEASNPGGTTIRRTTLTVLPDPVASFTPLDDTLEIGQRAEFYSVSGGQPPLRVYWDFGDGSTLVGEQNAAHIYTQGGVYRVRLAIENDFGRSEAMWDVTVGEPPEAELILPEQATVGVPVNGQAIGDATVQQFLWDMGDGRHYEGDLISHIYRRPGDYYVWLSADNGHGQTQSGRWIQVAEGDTKLFIPVAASVSAEQLAESALALAIIENMDPAIQTLNEVFTLEPIAFPPGTPGTDQLFTYINAARAKFGLPAVPFNNQLAQAAQAHALDKSRFPDNPHTGSDGTTGAERLLRVRYGGGYAGEATAWGFADPRLAVEFWINSDSHRPLLLNQLGSELGVGYVEDYATDNVWHWTAEFGIAYGVPTQAVLRQQMPSDEHSALDTEFINYTWMWPSPLSLGEHFTVYLVDGQRLLAVGDIDKPLYGSRYVLSTDARSLLGQSLTGSAARSFRWLVRLEDGAGGILAESSQRSITFTPDPDAPIILATPTQAIVTATPAAPTLTPTLPASTLEPPVVDTPPAIITATPLPTPEPSSP